MKTLSADAAAAATFKPSRTRRLGEQQRIVVAERFAPAPFPITAGLPPVTNAILRGGNPAFQLAAMREF